MANLKLQTKISTFDDVQKSLQSPAELEVTDKDGKTGDIKTTKNTDGSYTFEIRTIDGWKTPVFQEHPITFKAKLSSYSKKKLAKSIDEIEADDITTGDTQAKKNIFDEKSNKFILPRPDFESDWTNVDHASNYDITHNLGTKIFKLVQIVFKDDSDRIFYPGVWMSEQGTSDTGLYAYAKTDDIMEISTGNTYIYEYDNTTISGSFQQEADGYIKLMLWK